jgi:hypothetical protein
MKFGMDVTPFVTNKDTIFKLLQLVVSATEKLKFVRHDGEDTIAHATMRNHN